MTVDESIEAINNALDRLDRATDGDGRIVDGDIWERVKAEQFVREEDAVRFVASDRPADLSSLREHIDRRWGIPIPEDLEYLLERRNGLTMVEPDYDSDELVRDITPYTFEEVCWLPAAGIERQSGQVCGIETDSGEDLPLLPVACETHHGPVIALWIEPGSEEAPRVVTYHNAMSPGRHLKVCAEHLGAALQTYVEEGLRLSNVRSPDLGKVDTEPEKTERERREQQGRLEQTAVALQDPPSNYDHEELFPLFDRWLSGKREGKLREWSEALQISLCKLDPDRRTERDRLVEAAVAYAEEYPDKQEPITFRFLSTPLNFPEPSEGEKLPFERPDPWGEW